MNIIVPLHPEQGVSLSTQVEETQTPQRDLLSKRDIFGVGGLRLREGKENSGYILTLLMDALATPEFGKAYFGEIREDPAIQEKFNKIRSSKKSYNEQQRTKEVDEIITHLFTTHEADFKRSVLSGLEPLQQRLDSFKNNKKQDQQPLKDKIKKAIKPQKEKINQFKRVLNGKGFDPKANKTTFDSYNVIIKGLEDEIAEITRKIEQEEKIKEAIKTQVDNIVQHTKVLEGLDETENKKMFEDYNAKIKGREEEIVEITRKIKEEENFDLTTTISQRIDSTKKEIQQLKDINSGKDVKSEKYQELKKEYIARKLFLQKAEKQIAHTMYTKEEAAMQMRLFDWVQQQQATYKLPAKHPEKEKSVEYNNAIIGSKEMFLTVIDFKEHFISILSELLQIQLLEEKIKEKIQKLYPQYQIRVFKAPLIDDLRANTDCFIEVKGNGLKEDLYFAIDLKTSSNQDYLSKELKSEKRANKLVQDLSEDTLIKEIDQGTLHTIVFSYLEKAIEGDIDTRTLLLGEQIDNIIAGGEKSRDKNKKKITKDTIYTIIENMNQGALKTMVGLFLQSIIEGRKENFDVALLGPTLQKVLDLNIKNFGRSAPLHGTAYLLDIPAAKIQNFIMEISPSITYSMLHTILNQSYLGTGVGDITSMDPRTYEKIHATVSREQTAIIQNISYLEQVDALKGQLEKLFRKAA